MDVEARPAEEADLPLLVDLARAARQEQAEKRGGRLLVARHCRPEPLDLAFAEARADPTTGLWAGLVDGVPVGYALVSADGDVAVIEELHVDPQARAVGVGEALLDAIVPWARQVGCGGLDSFALPGARDTKNFFETFGMTARLLVLHRDLG
ncbi:MAG: GNAT family N-acetyltransferase [Acidimicrobiales bacterium]